jgi:hypothetical protein
VPQAKIKKEAECLFCYYNSEMSVINFKAKPFKIDSWTILRLPDEASKKLPSRGQAMVEGTINGYRFQTPLEPDGKWSHWFRVDDSLGKAAKIKAGDTVTLAIEPVKVWPEPDLPADFKKAVETDKKALEVWSKATPMAHWEWIRWIRSTNKQETHDRRIEVGLSKLRSGERRPCCWNRNLSTEPSVSKNGVLLTPA